MPSTTRKTILSGMRPTGKLHLGHLVGALENWVRLQEEYDNYHLVADYHALTTNPDTSELHRNSVDMVMDWLAAGIDPLRSPMFRQSQIKQHTELHLILSMLITAARLERNPAVKDQVRDLQIDNVTYGHLGYPVLQAADILLYKGDLVPVGEDQVPHIEMTREIARRFNHLFGKEPGFEEKANAAVKKLGGKRAKAYLDLRNRYQEKGDQEALGEGRALLASSASLSTADRERLFGYLEGARRVILAEPTARLTETPKLPGLDGQKMSKSYGNALLMREDPKSLTDKVRRMTTDPARVRRSDAGEPERCPVWSLHQIYTTPEVRDWAANGCRSAGIGCLECKQPVIEAMLREQDGWRSRAQPYLDDPSLLRSIVADGCDRARHAAQETMRDVREAMGLAYT